MKKMRKVIVGVLLIIMMVVLVGCGERKARTAENFKTNMVNHGYTVQDETYLFSYAGYVEKAYIAKDSSLKYQIEFYELSDIESAKYFYNYNKEIFETSKTSASMYKSVNVANYEKYTLQTDGKYKVISRIDNTVIYLDVDSQYKNAVDDVLEGLGY